MKNLNLLVFVIFMCGCASEPPEGLLGAYRLDDGRTVSIRRSADKTLRYRIYENGDSGRLYPDDTLTFVSGDGFAERDPVTLVVRFDGESDGVSPGLQWQPADGPALSAQRIGREQTHWFESGGTKLFGRLQLPESPPPYPLVVLVHGSGDSAATEWYFNGDFFAANGIAAFTYDKRGSGKSEGSFTFDFIQLAKDAVAAVDYVGSLPETDDKRIGLSGYSQGGWVAPLAASISDAISFVIVNYGMIESPAEEARLEMMQLVQDAGVSDADLVNADELIRASVDLVAGGFDDADWLRFTDVQKKYADAEWLVYLDGTPVDQLMTYPKFLVKIIGKWKSPQGLNWYYDSTELLENSSVPTAWFLAAEDRSAPNKQTITKLRSLVDAGRPVSLTVFPDADHSMLSFSETDGVRKYESYVPQYFRSEVEAVRRLTAVSPNW